MARVILSAITLTLISGLVLAAPESKEENTQLKVVDELNFSKADAYNWSYVLSDGRQVRQNGYTKQLEDGTEILVIDGFYSYVGPDGVKYSVSYYADENGYHPTVIVGGQELGPQSIDPKVLLSLIG